MGWSIGYDNHWKRDIGTLKATSLKIEDITQ